LLQINRLNKKQKTTILNNSIFAIMNFKKLKSVLKINKKTMKLNQLVGSVQALKELSSLKLPAMLAFKISKVMNEVDEHLKVFESTRTKKLEELGVKEMKKEKSEMG
jgi:hypothetical protein